MSTVLVPLACGFEDVEAVTIIDVLRRGGVNVVVAAVGDEISVMSAHGIVMIADAKLSDVLENKYEAIILPGGGEGTKNLLECESLLLRLQQQKQEGGLLCAICAAPLVLRKAGVLEGEDVTCYPSCSSKMGRSIKSVPVIADEQIITGQGPGQAMLFALVILQHLAGEEVMFNVANGMLTEIN